MAATHSDPVLSRVIKFTRSGWPDTVPDDLKPYWRKKDEIAAEGDCLFWGTCVIVPEKLRGRVLEELHRGHPGIVRMKSLARSHVWWPNLDSQVETQKPSLALLARSTRTYHPKHRSILGHGPLFRGNVST